MDGKKFNTALQNTGGYPNQNKGKSGYLVNQHVYGPSSTFINYFQQPGNYSVTLSLGATSSPQHGPAANPNATVPRCSVARPLPPLSPISRGSPLPDGCQTPEQLRAQGFGLVREAPTPQTCTQQFI